MTDVKRLEEALKYYESWNGEHFENIRNAALAHLEALKQETSIYFCCRGDDGSIHSIAHKLAEKSNFVCTPLYACGEEMKDLNTHIEFEEEND